MSQLTILRPDDWHLHVRDGAAMASVIPFTARQFARAVIMPNLKPPVTTVAQAKAYRERILQAVPAGSSFEPLMTLYLTDSTAPEEIHAARASGFIVGAKLYPAGATTHSDAGVTSIEKIFPALAAMEESGLVFQVHGEVTDQDIDIFDRECVFIDRTLAQVAQRFPRLKIVFEHVTTREAVQFVTSARAGVAATITPQHLLLNRNAIFQGGIRPHNYCLPVLKRERDRRALVEAATSDDPRFFLGTDSAPHARHTKETTCGCAGIFSAHAAIELYAEAFELAGRLDRLEAFASLRGPDFYGLPRNTSRITLERSAWSPPASYPFASDELIPFRAGESIAWRLTGGAAN
ncbi:dihydroorotase [Povalibacter uvarum]|uniref:Dihydroorotase n=1 Tax=Povalibacter uvarum TaxID=732238 RepID=A0A841HFA0_9GAMM|nr:dihydroorotase [Povalibacter uvarum]MBB6091363.1 dihydroorotase [Povalibacter uvarum]